MKIVCGTHLFHSCKGRRQLGPLLHRKLGNGMCKGDVVLQQNSIFMIALCARQAPDSLTPTACERTVEEVAGTGSPGPVCTSADPLLSPPCLPEPTAADANKDQLATHHQHRNLFTVARATSQLSTHAQGLLLMACYPVCVLVLEQQRSLDQRHTTSEMLVAVLPASSA